MVIMEGLTFLSPMMLSPSITLSQSNLAAMPLSKADICLYLIGRKVSNSKPNFSCSVPILQMTHIQVRYI